MREALHQESSEHHQQRRLRPTSEPHVFGRGAAITSKDKYTANKQAGNFALPDNFARLDKEVQKLSIWLQFG